MQKAMLLVCVASTALQLQQRNVLLFYSDFTRQLVCASAEVAAKKVCNRPQGVTGSFSACCVGTVGVVGFELSNRSRKVAHICQGTVRLVQRDRERETASAANLLPLAPDCCSRKRNWSSSFCRCCLRSTWYGAVAEACLSVLHSIEGARQAFEVKASNYVTALGACQWGSNAGASLGFDGEDAAQEKQQGAREGGQGQPPAFSSL